MLVTKVFAIFWSDCSCVEIPIELEIIGLEVALSVLEMVCDDWDSETEYKAE